jgi:hypothetical protein
MNQKHETSVFVGMLIVLLALIFYGAELKPPLLMTITVISLTVVLTVTQNTDKISDVFKSLFNGLTRLVKAYTNK